MGHLKYGCRTQNLGLGMYSITHKILSIVIKFYKSKPYHTLYTIGVGLQECTIYILVKAVYHLYKLRLRVCAEVKRIFSYGCCKNGDFSAKTWSYYPESIRSKCSKSSRLSSRMLNGNSIWYAVKRPRSPSTSTFMTSKCISTLQFLRDFSGAMSEAFSTREKYRGKNVFESGSHSHHKRRSSSPEASGEFDSFILRFEYFYFYC